MTIQKSYLTALAKKSERADKRKPDEFRKVTVETGVIDNAEGSARVRMGNTEVIAGVKLSVGTPFPDKLDEGVLISNAEFSPLSSAEFEIGRPGEDVIEFARVIDRGIRESKAIDVKKLCIEKGEKVWSVFIDIQIVNHDGNLADAGALAATAALNTAVFPEFDGENVLFGKKTKKKLPVTAKPVAVTVYRIADKFFLDPNADEEDLASVKLTIATNDDGNICAVQKSGSEKLTPKEIEEAIDLSVKKGKELRKLV